ncbi:MAG: hypothetical protein AABO41_17910 [Acidobacteriota bacterium]
MATRFVWLVIGLFFFCSVPAAAQTPKPNQPSPDTQRRTPEDRWSRSQETGLPEEMRTRMAMERAESDHRKILDDVDKLNHLSSEVARGYHERGKLSDEELKKLNTIEKLAKHVLNHTLGDEVEDKSPKPLTLAEAVDQMKAAAANIKKTMTAETRFEVSAVVIANSNEVISLAHFIKRTHGKAY